ncbi:MAG: flagellar motor protein MotB [Sandaracinaceae bacterium]
MDFGDDDEPEVEAGAPAWMATFSDMATLLLTFFVLLLSFANMDVIRFREMMGSVREAFGVPSESVGPYQARATSPVSIAEGGSPRRPAVINDAARVERIRMHLAERDVDGHMEVRGTPRGIAIRIRDGVLFASGSAELLPGGLPLLDELVDLAGDMPEDTLAIEGHTDDRPIHTTRFPSNWELSAARAVAVLAYLTDAGVDAERMSIAGYADVRPVGPNDSEEGRALNRRVEFIFQQQGLVDRPPSAADGRGPGDLPWERGRRARDAR